MGTDGRLASGGRRRRGARGLTAAGTLLGIGLGGFVDGILLHQVLQWHHLLTAAGSFPATTVAGLEDNTLADGLFHAGTWLATAAGLALLWLAVGRGGVTLTGRRLLGWMLFGWGLFNLVEGMVDHHLLQTHHVREGVENYEVYDIGFLAVGAVLVLAGLSLAGRDDRPAAPGRAGDRAASPEGPGLRGG